MLAALSMFAMSPNCAAEDISAKSAIVYEPFSATVLYVLPEAMRALYDFRMILYAIVLIVVMLMTWSPKFKQFIQVITAWIKETVDKLFKKPVKKEVGCDEER